VAPHLNVASCDFLQFESLIRQQQINEEKPSDEWSFGDDSNLHKKDFAGVRKHCKAIVQSDRNNETLHDSSPMNLNPAALKRLRVQRPPNREQELTLTFTRKGTSNFCLGESQRKSFCGTHSQNLMDHEYQRKSESGFQGVEERESHLSDSQQGTLGTLNSYSRSMFLSSMDDGKFGRRSAVQINGQMAFVLNRRPLLLHY